MRSLPALAVHHDDVVALQRRLDEPGMPAGHARRARIVLLSATGLDPASIARELGCDVQTVLTWRERYRRAGAAGLADAPRSGRPPTVSATRIVLRTLEPPPRGFARWTSRLLAVDLDLSNASVANAWRAWGVRPARNGDVALATEPPLPGVFSAVVGLHVRAPAAMLAVVRGTRWGGGVPEVPVADRPDLHGRVPDADGGRATPVADPDREVAFVRAVAGRPAGRGGGGGGAPGARPDVALLATGLSTRAVHVCAELGIAVFVASPTVAWARLVRVACLIAAAEKDGRTSVIALHDALGRDRSTAGFTWLPPSSVTARGRAR